MTNFLDSKEKPCDVNGTAAGQVKTIQAAKGKTDPRGK